MIVSFVFFLAVNSTVNAQMIDNSKGNALIDGDYFNNDFIRFRSIKSISGRFIHYKLGDKLRDTEFYRIYFFDTKGQLTKVEETSTFTSGSKPSVDLYEYDNNGNLTLHKHYDSYNDYVYFYTYDDRKRLTSKEFRHKYHQGEFTNGAFELGEEHTVYFEEYAYEEFNGQLHQFVFYKGASAPYKEVFTYYDDAGHIIEMEGRLKRATNAKVSYFVYNDDELIDSLGVRSRSDKIRETSSAFTYGENRSLKARKDFVKDELITKYEIIYSDETNLINDILIQDVKTNFIQILELRNYKYYGKDD